jgi:hypothetical protein
MPDDSLTVGQRKRLFALLIVAAPVTNRQLREQTGLALEGVDRHRLNDLKLVESHQPGRAFVHELTDKGWLWCKQEMAAPLPERDPGGKIFQALLNTLDRFIAQSRTPVEQIFQPLAETATPAVADQVIDVDARIRAAYGELSPGPEAWVGLARLRRHLSDVVQGDLDAALHRLNRAQEISLVADADQRRLTPEDKAAAVRIGGEDRHLLKVESA